jgi:HAD superfamily hydrolase (TIGR01450 family)
VKQHTHAFFDLDGTIYVDGKLIPQIKNSLQRLCASGTKIFYMTNNTSIRIEHYYNKLKKLGLPVADNSLITPVISLSNWMKHKKIMSFYAVGTQGFVDDVVMYSSANHKSENADLVIVAFDKELSYEKLEKAATLINAGVPWVVTNIDKACPTHKGPIPDCGAIADLIYSTTKVGYGLHFGKPGDAMIAEVLKLSEGSGAILVAGDRVYTDIEIGLALEATTVLVCSGEFQRGDLVDQHNRLEIFETLPEYIEAYLDQSEA